MTRHKLGVLIIANARAISRLFANGAGRQVATLSTHVYKIGFSSVDALK